VAKRVHVPSIDIKGSQRHRR